MRFYGAPEEVDMRVWGNLVVSRKEGACLCLLELELDLEVDRRRFSECEGEGGRRITWIRYSGAADERHVYCILRIQPIQQH